MPTFMAHRSCLTVNCFEAEIFIGHRRQITLLIPAEWGEIVFDGVRRVDKTQIIRYLLSRSPVVLSAFGSPRGTPYIAGVYVERHIYGRGGYLVPYSGSTPPSSRRTIHLIYMLRRLHAAFFSMDERCFPPPPFVRKREEELPESGEHMAHVAALFVLLFRRMRLCLRDSRICS